MKTGLYISLVGTDGSGKTTILDQTVKDLRAKGLSVVVESGNRFKFQMLPLNSLAQKKSSSTPATGTIKRPNFIYRFLISIVYGIEYTLRYYFRILPARRKHDVVIMDRGYLDLYVTRNTNHVVAKLFSLLFAPPRYIFLYHDLSVLAERRPEHDLRDLARQLRAYRSLSKNYWATIKTDKSSKGKVTDLILSAL